jgi:eukaryotic-like serine/threonine-protein kinase
VSSAETTEAQKLPTGSPEKPIPFGKYRLLGLIARGGMAEVFRGINPAEPKSLVAIKCMRPQLAKEGRFVDMFIREGKLALLLDHQNIVRTLEIGRSEGRYFITMEYIAGRDLTQLLRRCQENNQRIPVPHAVFIASSVCRGLHYAHNRSDPEGRLLNIVNRDVSPSNVRLGYDGEVKLLDFGIAQGMLKFTSEIGILKGKFSYMSPEQIRGMPVDARTDIFSTGILLHEMLTTEKLFRGDSEFDLMEKVRSAVIPPPSKFNRRVKPELDEVVLRAMAREPADRYQTAAEFADTLDGVLQTYGFSQEELRDFLRQMFPTEYGRELEETRACHAAKLDHQAAAPPAAVHEDDVEDLMHQTPVRASISQRPDAVEPSSPPTNKLLIWVILAAAIAIAATAVVILAMRSG